MQGEIAHFASPRAVARSALHSNISGHELNEESCVAARQSVCVVGSSTFDVEAIQPRAAR